MDDVRNTGQQDGDKKPRGWLHTDLTRLNRQISADTQWFEARMKFLRTTLDHPAISARTAFEAEMQREKPAASSQNISTPAKIGSYVLLPRVPSFRQDVLSRIDWSVEGTPELSQEQSGLMRAFSEVEPENMMGGPDTLEVSGGSTPARVRVEEERKRRQFRQQVTILRERALVLEREK